MKGKDICIKFSGVTRPSWGPASLYRGIVDSVLVRKNASENSNSAILVTKPGALVKIPFGKGFLVIDQINWEKIESRSKNHEKAKRYITNLLTNLGVDFY